jgi:hypothetical protein
VNLTLEEVISASCAVHRKNGGFVKTSDPRVSQGLAPNSKLMYDFLLGTYDENSRKNIRKLIQVNESDIERARDIIEYLKGLSFKALERNLTSFESNVLKLVTSHEISKEQIGIAASLPKVYENKLDQDRWADRESELARSSEFVGELRKRCEFNDLVVENVRHIASVGSNLVCCSKDDNIIKFFNANDNRLTGDAVGAKINLVAYVKAHQVSKYHGGKETMVNRVKVTLNEENS